MKGGFRDAVGIPPPPDTKLSSPSTSELPGQFQPRTLRIRGLQGIAALAVFVGIFVLAPGLGEVRDRLADASFGWLALATVLEGLSFASYVVMFGPIFCTGLGWRRSWQIGGAEQAMGSLVPASGAGGLALGAWVLSRGGMDGERIARRSVAFFLIKSAVNFLAVAVLGTVMALGLLGPERSLWLTAFPAVVATLALGAVVAMPRLGPGHAPGPKASRRRRGTSAARRALIDGSGEALQIARSGNRRVLVGSFGYWAFDNAMLWATFHAFGLSPPITVVLMGYLIGQLGGLLPIPGGVGGIDGGLIGALIVYGAPAADSAAAVLAFRVILFWLPLIVGGIAFASLRRDMPTGGELAACAPAIGGVGSTASSDSPATSLPPPEAGMAETTCTHLDQIEVKPPRVDEVAGCEECLKTGDRWVHLRVCLSCGTVGCCDSSPNRHATKHAGETRHAIARSLEPGEDWCWCYEDQVGLAVDFD